MELREKKEEQTKRFLAHVRDLITRCERQYQPCYTAFLDEAAAARAMQVLIPDPDQFAAMLWGGHAAAQRVVYSVYPVYEQPEPADFPIVCLTIRLPVSQHLSHRDVLGAFLSCGLERDTIGDILFGEGMAQVFVLSSVSAFLQQNIRKIGRVGVRIVDNLPFSLSVTQEFEPISGTVASLRADAIAAFAAKISREKAVAMIQHSYMERNHNVVSSPSEQLTEGDQFVLRGFGKFRLTSISGVTKKGRLHILVEKYK